MSGKFYAVGIGSGDFEYLTLKAKRVIEQADVIAAPVKKCGEKSTALEIVKKAVDLSEKRIEEVEFLMSGDRDVRLNSRKRAIEKIKMLLSENNDVAMITLGDVTVYSTCVYVNKQIRDMGFDTEMVSGVPSFCAAAADAQISLCEENETLAVIPAIGADVDFGSVIDNFDNIVIMKAGRNMNKIYDCLDERNLLSNAVIASRVGMDGGVTESIRRDGDYGYFTTVIIKKSLGDRK